MLALPADLNNSESAFVLGTVQDSRRLHQIPKVSLPVPLLNATASCAPDLLLHFKYSQSSFAKSSG